MTSSTISTILSEINQGSTVRNIHILNEEQHELLILCWEIQNSKGNKTQIGICVPSTRNIQVLHTSSDILNIIHASINKQKTVLAFVTKEKSDVLSPTKIGNDFTKCQISSLYTLHVLELGDKGNQYTLVLKNGSQIKSQFLYKTKNIPVDCKKYSDQLLVFLLGDSILVYNIELTKSSNGSWVINGNPSVESILRSFIWASWDAYTQQLHYVHYRQLLSGGGDEQRQEAHAMLSCLQFHDEMPHETVLNIPLQIPEIPQHCDDIVHEDLDMDNVPLRIHNGLLNLCVSTDSSGVVCICHHYLYQAQRVLMPSEVKVCEGQMITVHFAYSVTLLHHSCVLHVVLLDIPFEQAKSIHLTCTLYGDYLLVVAPGFFFHALDIGLTHEPGHHMFFEPSAIFPTGVKQIIPLHKPKLKPSVLFLNLDDLNVLDVNFDKDTVLNALKASTPLIVKLAALHYFVCHQKDLEGAKEILGHVCLNPLNLEITKVFEEFLMSSAYSGAKKNLPSDGSHLLSLLPYTILPPTATTTEVKVGKQNICVCHTPIGNVATMLLSPQQRLAPYCVDTWTRLWERLQKVSKDNNKLRFKSKQVAEKLMFSLLCYQPEALSRVSTPMSPSSPLLCTGTMADITGILSRKGPDVLPFLETESCTASKQEYVISVNLRELSVHLLKSSAKDSPMHIHAVATKYVGAQLEMSRLLCHLTCTLAGVDPEKEQERGFRLIDQLEDSACHLLFILMERYFLAVEEVAFPLPQGFQSFFSYLAYRTQPFQFFIQYIQNGVLDLHVDVLRIIMADLGETKDGVKKKLQLVSLLPRPRAKRVLNQWAHPQSLMLRAREHALNILSGEGGKECHGRLPQNRKLEGRGLAAYPSASDRLSPLDTFLNLLTAKASLTELDVGLLVEATVSSTEDAFQTDE